MLCSSAAARPWYLDAFNDMYKTKRTKLDGCNTCHDTNYYEHVLGKLYETQEITTALRAVEALDSDGDKFTNLQEIEARTLPGDPRDFPSRGSRRRQSAAGLQRAHGYAQRISGRSASHSPPASSASPAIGHLLSSHVSGRIPNVPSAWPPAELDSTWKLRWYLPSSSTAGLSK